MSQYFNGPAGATPPGLSSPPPQVPPSLSSLALIAFLVGLASLPLFFFLIPGVVALLLGAIAFFRIRSSGGRKKGTILAYLAMLTGLISFGLSAMVLKSSADLRNDPAFAAKMAEATAKRAPLNAAENLILSSRGGAVGHGNTPAAKEVATEFATLMKSFRSEYFTGDADSGLLSGGEFLTFCQINEESCAIITHIPNFRKFEEDAKEALSDQAWALAQHLLSGAGVAPETALAVGTKGVISYHRIDRGKIVGSENLDLDGSLTQGLTNPSGASPKNDSLEYYFPAKETPPASDPAPAPAPAAE